MVVFIIKDMKEVKSVVHWRKLEHAERMTQEQQLLSFLTEKYLKRPDLRKML